MTNPTRRCHNSIADPTGAAAAAARTRTGTGTRGVPAAALSCLLLAGTAVAEDIIVEREIDGYAVVESGVTPLGTTYEAADDFTATGSIERIWIYGSNCCLGSCSFPTDIVELTIRIYDVADGQPGTILAEYVFDGDDPDFLWDEPNGPRLLDVTLPEPFEADGTYFISAIPEFTTFFCWAWWSSNNNNPEGSPVWWRQDGGPWGPYDTGFGDLDADLAFALIGTPAEPDEPPVFIEDGCSSVWEEIAVPDLGPGEGGIPNQVSFTRNTLNDLVVLSATDIWAVGAYGYQELGSTDGELLALTMHYDGTSWTPVPTPNPTNVLGEREVQLEAVDAVSSDLLYAAGTYTNEVPNASDTLVMRWDGTEWEQLISPGQSGFGASGFLFEDVAAIDAENIWFGGQFAGAPGSPDATMVHYDGSDFTTYSLPRDPGATTAAHRIRAISALGPNDIWAAGSVGGSGVAVGSSYVAHWDGSSWERIPTPQLGVQEIVRDVVALASDDVWISGVYRLIPPKGGPLIPMPLFLHWDGSSWTAFDSPAYAHSMAVLAPDRIYGVEGETLVFWNGAEWGLAGDLDEDLLDMNLRALGITDDCELLAVGSTVGSIANTRAARYRPAPDPADLDGDGMVGIDDLLAMLAAWGPCGGDCPADLDADGAVGLSDLIEVLGGWTA